MSSTFQQIIDKFLDYYRAQSARSATTYRTGLNHFARWMGDGDIEAETLIPAQAREFAIWLANDYRTEHGKRLNRTSLHLYLVALLKFYDYLILNDIIKGDNFMGTRKWVSEMIKGAQRAPIEKKLPPSEIVATLLDAVDQEPDIPEGPDQERRRLVWLRNRAIIYCLESSGARVGEIAGLRLDDLIRADKGAWVTGKGNKTRFIRISPDAWQRLDAYLRARSNPSQHTPLFCRHDRAAGNKVLGLSTLTIERTVNRLAEETGISEKFHLTPHSLRHYFATRFLRHTGDLALTQDVLGHANPSTTRIYAKTSKEQIIKAHSEIFD